MHRGIVLLYSMTQVTLSLHGMKIFNDVVNEYLPLKQKRVKRNAQPK